jgi:hypothetical protein
MKAFLVRCYPARWRVRYGDEFEAILEERALGPFDVADILLGALDARLRFRGTDAAPHRQRGFTMSLRLGGSAAILGGILFTAGLVVASIDGADDGFPGLALILAGTAALLVALTGLSSFQARRHPRLIWAAFALPALGTALSCVGLVAMAVVGDRPIVADLSPWSIWFLGVLATVVGSALFALATYRTGALSRYAAAMLAGGSVLLLAVGVVGMGISGIGVAEALAPLLTLVGVLAFSAGWIALGWAAIRLDRPATEPRPT